jgi:hypothetical protein
MEVRMITVHIDTGRLCQQELDNISRALRERCPACVELGVPQTCGHPGVVREFMTQVADALDIERDRRAQRAREAALGVESDTGEWLPGA